MSEKLTKLMERVHTATGPDRELDADIAVTFLGVEIKREPNNRNWRIGHRQTKTRDAEPWIALPFYTASIDAALALTERVLPGCRVEIQQSLDGTWWDATLFERGAYEICGETDRGMPSPSLALISATLIALIAQGQTP